MATDSKPTFLADYDTEAELAGKLGVSEKTLRNWRRDGAGPPHTVIATRIYYYQPSTVKWLRSKECGAKRTASNNIQAA
jgi:DNA-binding transcriptional MerR regulator